MTTHGDSAATRGRRLGGCSTASRWLAFVVAGLSCVLAACSSSSGTDASPRGAGTGSGTSTTADAALHRLLPASIKSAGVLRLGTTTGNAPMDFANTSGQAEGVDIDLARAAGKILGVRVTFIETKFSGLIAGELAGRWDAIWAAMNDNEAREQQVTFVDYFKHGFSVLVPSGNPKKISAQSDFCGLSFAEAQGSFFQKFIPTISKTVCTSKGKPAIKLNIYPDNQGTYQALSTGRVNAIMAAEEQVTYEANLNDRIQAVRQININPVHYGVGITPNNTGLVKAIKGALTRMRSDGTYTAIVNKWKLGAQAIPKIVINTPAA